MANVHLIGIGGVGMAGLAVLLKSRGHAVSGCDLKATPRTRWLEEQGVPVEIGHSPDHVATADEVIVTPAVERTNPEVLACCGACAGNSMRSIPLRTRGEVLAEIVNQGESIAVCGSHGKTTTATWIARLLRALGENVAWCIGGETGAFPVAGVPAPSQAGRDTVLVVEADESDGTLALYRAKTLVVNKCDYDHPDHFKTEADYFACYDAAKRQAGTVIESEQLPEICVQPASDEEAALARLFHAMPLHNRRNMRAAIEVALRRGHSLAAITQALPPIVAELPDRRFQKIAEGVYADYAHHPTEMRCAIEMARQRCSGVLRVLFQPHRYSRTKALLSEFPAAFRGADEVILCPTYAAFEQPLEGGLSADLYCACRRAGVAGLFLSRSCEEAWEHVRNSMQAGDVTLLLGAGDIIELVPLVRQKGEGKRRRIWIGAGANTWKSDLNLSVDYVKTTGPAGAPGASLGIPWMAGIPGTVGGWIKMNAGAFGHSIAEVLSEVKVEGRWIPAADCGFSYRHSDITGEIQDFKLKADARQADALSAADYLARRKAFPAGTYGSFFKNPANDFAGRLLEEAGAQELKVGGAFVWSEHANVIVRGPTATASDVLALAYLMRARVWFRTGVWLESEVQGIPTPRSPVWGVD